MDNCEGQETTIKDKLKCEICSDYSDGNHYDIQACRSCTAFFRRTITFKKKYYCNGNNDCNINYQNRNTCKSCRFKKCLAKGMNISSVQPRREPTGAQPNRKNRRISLPNLVLNNDTTKMENDIGSSDLPKNNTNGEVGLNCTFRSEKIIARVSDNSSQSRDCDDNDDTISGDVVFCGFINSINVKERLNITRVFKKYVRKYIEIKESLKFMHSTDPVNIINNSFNDLPLKLFTSKDMVLLARSDLASVTLWISNIEEYTRFTTSEKALLLQRFALRKIMLDHCYMTSKYKEYFERGNLVMPNYTYIPSDMTGYEKESDNLSDKKVIYSIFKETQNYTIECVIKPMNELNLTEEEIVFLYLLILWNKNNEKYVSSDKSSIFSSQRNWALKCLFIHYYEKNLPSPEVRFGEITLLLKELETCCVSHFEDYVTSQFSNITISREKWYDNICYSSINLET
uniref:Nuclear receptor n=1 Tax=Strongyloides stercoralis TaxID=6248 RepID=A0A0K0EPK6_STRER